MSGTGGLWGRALGFCGKGAGALWEECRGFVGRVPGLCGKGAGFCGSWAPPGEWRPKGSWRHAPTLATPPGRLRRHSPGRADLPPVVSSLTSGADLPPVAPSVVASGRSWVAPGFCGSWALPGEWRPKGSWRHAPTLATPPGRLRRHSPGRADLPPVASSLTSGAGLPPVAPSVVASGRSWVAPAVRGRGALPGEGRPKGSWRLAPTLATPPGRLRRHSPGRADLPPVASSLTSGAGLPPVASSLTSGADLPPVASSLTSGADLPPVAPSVVASGRSWVAPGFCGSWALPGEWRPKGSWRLAPTLATPPGRLRRHSPGRAGLPLFSLPSSVVGGSAREPLVNPAASTHNGRRFDVEETTMKLLNRSALSVRPTQHFVDWINGLEPTLGDDDLALADVERESTVYLIPEMDTPEALEAFVRERYLEILETELRAWEEDERQWPETVDWPLFQRFLQVEHSYLAIDLDDEAALEISEIDDSLLLDVDQD